MKKIAIIGSNSFLAKSIIPIISGNYLQLFSRSKPTNLSKNAIWTEFNFPTKKVNLTSLLNSDIIIYCAAAGVQSNIVCSDEEIKNINTTYPLSLINSLNKNKYKGTFISFGSYFEIGNTNKNNYIKEIDLVNHTNIYPNAYCKFKNDFTRKVEKQTNSFNHFHLILPNIYGVGENENRLLPYIFDSVKKGNPLHFSAGNQVRQYLHVNDVAKAVNNISIENLKPGIYNLSFGEPTSIRKITEMAISIANKGNSYQATFGTIEKRDSSMHYLALDNSKAIKHLKWQPSIKLENGLIEYLA